jgi:hypothetical protein
MQEPFSPIPNLRRAWIAGYKVADVEILVAKFGFQVSQLASEVRTLQARLAEVQAERLELEHRLDAAHAREDELVRAAATIHDARLHELEAARKDAVEIVEAAELAAAEIRSDADRQSETARAEVEELTRLRESLSATMRGVVRDFESVVRRIDRGGEEAAIAAPPAAAAPRIRPPEPAESELVPEAVEGDVFDGRVELLAGPFNDFASLSAFERALESLPKINDVYIRRFEGDQATIALTLLEPSPLIRELTERMPYTLDVERSDLDHIAVTVSAAR